MGSTPGPQGGILSEKGCFGGVAMVAAVIDASMTKFGVAGVRGGNVRR
jgi:hypothetical protein